MQQQQPVSGQAYPVGPGGNQPFQPGVAMPTQEEILAVPPPSYAAEPTKGGAHGMVQPGMVQPGMAQPEMSQVHMVGPTPEPLPTTQQMVTPLNSLGDHPQFIDCPFCHRRAQTRLNKVGTSMQIVAGAVLCLFCICLTCLPCILGWCENTEYFCTSCNQKVAIRTDGGGMQVFGPQQPSMAPQPSQPARQ